MPKRTIKFNLDFSKKDILSKFEIKQFDNAIIEISPFLDNLSYAISESTNIKLYVCISNDIFMQESSISIQENKIIIDLDKNIIAKKGKALAELELSDVAGVTTSTTFIFDVEDKVGEGSVIPGGAEGLIAKYQRLLREFKQEQQLQLDDINKTLESHAEQLNSNKSQLAQIENKNIEQDSRLKDVENKNKVQDVYLSGLFNENKDGRLSVEGEGNDLKLEGSKQGLVEIDKVVGNTFVNIANNTFNRVSDSIRRMDINNLLKTDTTYTIISTLDTIKYQWAILNSSKTILGYNNQKVLTFTTDTSSIMVYIRFNSNYTNETKINVAELYDKIMILEGDYTNKPIPSEYIEGLQSSFEENLVTQDMVTQGLESAENLGKYKVPIKVTGKNLFDKSKATKDKALEWGGGIPFSEANAFCSDFIRVQEDTTYTLSCKSQVFVYDENEKCIGRYGSDGNIIFTQTTGSPVSSFKIPKGYNKCYIRIGVRGALNYDINIYQIEEGTVATEHEDYFERTTNVYLNSPLLEGDEIVMHDGELCHYHKMGKDILDGSDNEGWDSIIKTNSNNINYVDNLSILSLGIENRVIYCDKLLVVIGNQNKLTSVGQIVAHSSSVYSNRLYISTDKNTIDEFKQWLQYNPVTVVYQLVEPWYEPIQADKLLLECANTSTLSVESVVPVESISASYTGNVPSVYALEETNQTQDNLIDISLCATDEMYEMIEPLLEAIPQTLNNERMVSKMVDMYVAMVIRELKTIEEVPARYREQVQAILDKLEK